MTTHQNCGLDGKSDHCWSYGDGIRKCSYCHKKQTMDGIWVDLEEW